MNALWITHYSHQKKISQSFRSLRFFTNMWLINDHRGAAAKQTPVSNAESPQDRTSQQVSGLLFPQIYNVIH
jgi:hypothetical protein